MVIRSSVCAPPSSRRRILAQLTAGTTAALLASRLRAEVSATAAKAGTKISDDLLFTSAKRIAALIKAKKTSSLEVTRGYIARIEAVNPKLNATAELTELLEKQDASRSRLLGWMKSYDIVINPVMPKPAQPINLGDQPNARKPGAGYVGVHNTSGYPVAVVRPVCRRKVCPSACRLSASPGPRRKSSRPRPLSRAAPAAGKSPRSSRIKKRA